MNNHYNKIYQLVLNFVNQYFEENKLKFLLNNIDYEIIDFICGSKKKIAVRKSVITLKFFDDVHYIQYQYNLNITLGNEMDSNFLGHKDFDKVKYMLSKSMNDLDIVKIHNLLQDGDKFGEYYVAFLKWVQKSIEYIGSSIYFEDVLQINTKNREFFYIILVTSREEKVKKILLSEYKKQPISLKEITFDEFLEEEVNKKGYVGILGNSKYPEVVEGNFAIYQFDIEDLE